MSRQPYRTQSDTLKLQRLISVLKERGSDLGNALESSASDFLSDVKPRTTHHLSQTQGGTSSIPHYTGDCEDEGSSFGDASDWGSEWEEDEDEDEMEEIPKGPPPTPAESLKKPSFPVKPPKSTEKSENRLTPPPPKVAPPPVPNDEEPLNQSVRRRSSVFKALRKDAGIAAMMKKQLGVRFKEPSPNDEDDEDDDGPGSRRKNSSVGNLLKTSALMLQSLTLNISKEELDALEKKRLDDLTDEKDVHQSQASLDEELVSSTSPISVDSPLSNERVSISDFVSETMDVESSPGASSGEAMIRPNITISSEPDPSNYEDQGEDQNTNIDWEKDSEYQSSSMAEDSPIATEDDDFRPKKRLAPKHKKRKSTLATQWRKQRERKRSGSMSPNAMISENLSNEREQTDNDNSGSNPGNNDAQIDTVPVMAN